MKKNKRTSTYARAFWELGIRETDIEVIEESFRENPQLRKVLEDPRVSRQDKNRVIDRAFLKSYQGILRVLVKYEMVECLEDIKKDLLAERDRKDGRVTARLSYVKPPSLQEKAQMESMLKKKFHAEEICWVEEEKPELLGGFLLEVNGWEYDYSTKGRWLKLGQSLVRR